MTLEDALCDVLSKAMHGLDWTEDELAKHADVPLDAVRAALEEHPASPPTDNTVINLGRTLSLDTPSLLALRDTTYHPEVTLPDTITRIESPFGDMLVNNYLLCHPEDPGALLIDTGADFEPLLRALAASGREPTHLLLTHDHPDHLALLDAIRKNWPQIEVFAPELDPVDGATLFTTPCSLQLAGWQVRCLPTPGHTDGCTSFLIDTPDDPVCFVGDALFAGSIGGPRFSYEAALNSLKSQLLPLAPETIVCPGHGPPTTIRLESLHNPFLVTMVPETHSNTS